MERLGDRYREIVESSEALVTICDQDGELSFVNRRAADLAGMDASAALGRNWLDLFARAGQRKELGTLRAKILAGEPVGAREIGVLDERGRERRVRWAFTVLQGEGEPALCALGVDVTAEQEKATRAGQAERQASLGALTAGLAHEIRNPLNSAQLQLTLAARRLRQQPPDVGTALAAVELAEAETRRLSSLVDEFMEFARPQPLWLAVADLRALAEEAVRALASEARSSGVALSVEPGRLVRATVDADRLNLALVNLARNGIQAAPAGGSVRIAVESEGGDAIMRVSDDGPGFPEHARMFEPFFTTKETGTGLGLATVHRVATDHRGQIAVERRSGQTHVILRIPGVVDDGLSVGSAGTAASEPQSLPPSVVRRQVLGQHQVLRQKLQRALDMTASVLHGAGPEREPLAGVVRDLREHFRAHLAFEERKLAPVLAEADVWGPDRVKNLLAEHERQRAELDTLIEGIETGWDPERLALAARSLATDLLLDMEEEERGTLSAELLRDDVVCVDQATD